MVPQAHLPVVYYKVIDDISLVLVGMHVQWLDVVLHKKRSPLLGL